MPYEITLSQKPMGYALRGGVKGDKIPVVMRDFSSSGDGEFFLARLDGAATQIVRALPPQARITPSGTRVTYLRHESSPVREIELFPELEQLRKSGTIVRLSRQPFRALLLLATCAGAVVTREEIRSEWWGSDTFVDFNQGI